MFFCLYAEQKSAKPETYTTEYSVTIHAVGDTIRAVNGFKCKKSDSITMKSWMMMAIIKCVMPGNKTTSELILDFFMNIFASVR